MEAQSCTIRRYSSRKTHQRRQTTSQRMCADGQWRNCCSEMEMLFLWVTKVYCQQVAHCCAVTLLQWCQTVRGAVQSAVLLSWAEWHRKKGKEKKEEAGWETATVLAACAQFECDAPAEQSHLKDLKHLFFWGFSAFNSVFWPTGGIYTLTFIQRKCTLCVFSFL